MMWTRRATSSPDVGAVNAVAWIGVVSFTMVATVVVTIVFSFRPCSMTRLQAQEINTLLSKRGVAFQEAIERALGSDRSKEFRDGAWITDKEASRVIGWLRDQGRTG